MSELTIFNSNALDQAYEYANKICVSELIPKALRNKPADVCIVLQTGIELGFSPMVALRSVDVIYGTPALKPQAMLALIRSKLPNSVVKVTSDNKSATCKIIRDRNFPEDCAETTWTIERAQRMGLLDKENWKKQPETMLKWRAVGEAARFSCSDILGGMYNSSEVSDFENHDDYLPESHDIAQDIKDFKTSLSDPENVESETTKEDIEEAQFKELKSSSDAVEEAEIIKQIENRDYIMPLGQFKDKKLYEVNIVNLRKYLSALESGLKKVNGKKPSEAQSALIANLSAYVDKYNRIEISIVSGDTSKDVPKDENSPTKKITKASQASFRITENE